MSARQKRGCSLLSAGLLLAGLLLALALSGCASLADSAAGRGSERSGGAVQEMSDLLDGVSTPAVAPAAGHSARRQSRQAVAPDSSLSQPPQATTSRSYPTGATMLWRGVDSRQLGDISLDTQQVPIEVFFGALSALTGLDIALDSGMHGEISLSMQRASWRAVARTAASQLGLHANLFPSAHLVRIQASPCSSQRCAEQRVYRLRHADAAVLAPLLRQAAQQSGTSLVAAAEEAGNRLVLSGAAEAVEGALQLAQRLDSRRAVILVEMWILETSDERSRLLGLDLGLSADAGSAEDSSRRNLVGGLPAADEFSLLRQSPVGAGAAAAIVGRLDRERLSLRLAALEQDGFTRILSNPRIYTMDGEPAEVFQGDEVPYTVRTDNGGSHTEFRQAGLRLEVLPRAMAGGDISLRLRISKDTVDRSRASPPISRREMRTRLMLRPGSIAIIGGIRADGESGRRSGAAPFGALLGSGEGQSGSARLLVILSATVVGP